MRLNKKLQSAYKTTNTKTPKDTGEVPVNKNTPPPTHQGTSMDSSEFLKVIRQGKQGQAATPREIAGFLLLIGKDEAAQILSLLPEDLVERLTLEISKIRVLGSQEKQEIIERFNIAIQDKKSTLRGGNGFALELLEKSMGEEKAHSIMDKVLVPAPFDQLEFLNELEPAQLQHLLSEEAPRLIGIILSHLEPKLAAELLKRLPDTDKPQIIHTMRERVNLSRETFQSIAESLKKKILRTGTQQSTMLDGSQILAEILRNMDVRSEQNILHELGMTVPEIQSQIKDRLFTIEQVLHIHDTDFQNILAEMNDDDIALLMKGKDEEIRLRFLNNVSTQRSIAISETYHAMGPLPRKEVDEATKKFIDKVRAMEEAGEITIYRDSDEFVE